MTSSTLLNVAPSRSFGTGQHGTTYQETLSGSPVAIKRYFSVFEGSSSHAFSVLEKINSLHIPHALHQRAYIAPSQVITDYIPSESVLMTNTSLQWKDIRAITEQLLEFLEKLHQNNLIHANLDSDHLIFEKKHNHLTVINYRLARDLASQEGRKLPVGTSEYRPPEIVLGGDPSTAVDMWAFGCIVYEMVVGNFLIDADEEGILLAICKMLGLPSLSFVQSFPEVKDVPWKVEGSKVLWKESYSSDLLPWEPEFREAARDLGASEGEITFFIQILQKVLCFENRATAADLLKLLKKKDELRFETIGLKKEQTFILASQVDAENEVQIELEGKDGVHRSCLHLPASRDNTYYATLKSHDTVVVNRKPILLSNSFSGDPVKINTSLLG